MQPYTYSQSRLTPYAERDGEFAGGPVSGSAAPNAQLADGSHLLDRAGHGMTAILFSDGEISPEQAVLLDSLRQIDRRFVALVVGVRDGIADQDGEIARAYAATPGTIYLLRPDLHIAGRWKTAVPAEILKTAGLCLGSNAP
jgi:3-(3-hydroxy-phenyl)propionate hydroxylase